MITAKRLKTLKPGTNLYRILTSKKRGETTQTCEKAAIKSVTKTHVNFIINTKATSDGLKHTIPWVCANMSLSRVDAWDGEKRK